jgi:hypothetical protein
MTSERGPRRFAVEYCERTGETILTLGDERLTFTYEEWSRARIHFGQVVQISEVRPLFALFGTRTIVRWADKGIEREVQS